MKKASFIFLMVLILAAASGLAQQKKIDTLRLTIKSAKTDTQKYIALHDLGAIYVVNHVDSAILIDQQAYLLAEKHQWLKNEAICLNNMGAAYFEAGDYTSAVQNYMAALKIHERRHDLPHEAATNGNLGVLFSNEHADKEALYYHLKALQQWQTYALSHSLTAVEKTHNLNALLGVESDYFIQHRTDSTEKYLNAVIAFCKKNNMDVANIYDIPENQALLDTLKRQYKPAIALFHKAIKIAVGQGNNDQASSSYHELAWCFYKMKQPDSAKFYAHKALTLAQAGGLKDDIIYASKDLYTYYDEEHNTAEAYKYYKLYTATKDSVYNQGKVTQVLTIGFNEKLRQRELSEAEAKYQDTLRTRALAGGLGALVLVSGIFWRSSNQRKKANMLLVKQKQEIEEQRDLTNKALDELQQTQTQLIQREKMASLGELTAGIAHEIQNPLNFVNNFSDVNREMIDELEHELKSGNIDEALVITADLKDNEGKINHHGKRAEVIVKGMLEHSRTSTGERQVTNINVLADEFLKLSYHGLRAKDKNFNSELVTNFDSSLPKINVVQQDIGRVLINLFGNAFYAVNQKAKAAGPDYRPTVEVDTARQNGSILITVKDNGTGIPENIREKIMQPFFTTKPTGEGTGLGLSLSYDIVVKGHGGSIDVDTKEGEFTEFVVSLPLV